MGPGLDHARVTTALAGAFTTEFGPRCAVVNTAQVLLGVVGGQLTLHGLDGRELAPPSVVYARVSTPTLSSDGDVTLLRHLHALGAALVNPIGAVLACVNKFWQLQELASAGLPVPDTRTYTTALRWEAIAAGVPEPCVVKAVRGHRGGRVFLARDAAMLQDVQGSLADGVPYLFQDYVAHSHGRDLRVVVVDGRAVAAQIRTGPAGRLQSNVALGGTATPCLGLHPDGETLAREAACALGLGVAGVDLLFEPDGSFTVCEVNANVGWGAPLDDLVLPAIIAACRNRLDVLDDATAPATLPPPATKVDEMPGPSPLAESVPRPADT